jgi:RNA polymerase sigma factor (sigma-70 family)
MLQGGRSGDSPGRLPDRAVLAELYEKYAATVYGRCRYLLRDDEEAKDALQEVFARALKALPEFRAAASPTTWILRIATHHCLNVLRARRAGWRDQLAVVARERRVDQESPDRRELVRALLGAASDEAQEVAVLYYVDEMTQGEIGEAIGRSLPTVRKRLREFLGAARAALAEALPGISLPEGDEP